MAKLNDIRITEMFLTPAEDGETAESFEVLGTVDIELNEMLVILGIKVIANHEKQVGLLMPTNKVNGEFTSRMKPELCDAIIDKIVEQDGAKVAPKAKNDMYH